MNKLKVKFKKEKLKMKKLTRGRKLGVITGKTKTHKSE